MLNKQLVLWASGDYKIMGLEQDIVHTKTKWHNILCSDTCITIHATMKKIWANKQMRATRKDTKQYTGAYTEEIY